MLHSTLSPRCRAATDQRPAKLRPGYKLTRGCTDQASSTPTGCAVRHTACLAGQHFRPAALSTLNGRLTVHLARAEARDRRCRALRRASSVRPSSGVLLHLGHLGHLGPASVRLIQGSQPQCPCTHTPRVPPHHLQFDCQERLTGFPRTASPHVRSCRQTCRQAHARPLSCGNRPVAATRCSASRPSNPAQAQDRLRSITPG